MAGTVAKILIEDMERHALCLELHIDEESYEQNIWHGYENEEAITFDAESYTRFWL